MKPITIFKLLTLFLPIILSSQEPNLKKIILTKDSIELRFFIPDENDLISKKQEGITQMDNRLEALFNLDSSKLVDVIDCFAGRNSFRRRNGARKFSKNNLSISFLDKNQIHSIIREKNCFLFARQINKTPNESIDYNAFRITCKRIIFELLNLEEIKTNVEKYNLSFNIKSPFYKNYLFFKKERRKKAKLELKKKNILLSNYTILELKQFINNRYNKLGNHSYQLGEHPISIGNYIIKKIEVPIECNFQDFIEILNHKYGILIKVRDSDFKGIVYQSKSSKIREHISFSPHDTITYQDEYIKVEINSSSSSFNHSGNDTLVQSHQLIYYTLTRPSSAFEKLYYGIKHTGKGHFSILRREREEINIPYLHNGFRVVLKAENLQPENLNEIEFREKVEEVYLKNLNYEKKYVEVPLYSGSYDFEKVKQNLDFSLIGRKEMPKGGWSSTQNLDTLEVPLTVYLNTRNIFFPNISTVELPCEKLSEKERKEFFAEMKDYEYKDQVFHAERVFLPKNDIKNLIYVLREKYGIMVSKTGKFKSIYTLVKKKSSVE